jgi:hypothetical protein
MSEVVVTRSRHPLQGQALVVLGRRWCQGQVELLLVLPDGTKSLVPAAWTDWEPAVGDSVPAVGSLADL